MEITEGPGRVVVLTIAFAAGTAAGVFVAALGDFGGAGDNGVGEAGDGMEGVKRAAQLAPRLSAQPHRTFGSGRVPEVETPWRRRR